MQTHPVFRFRCHPTLAQKNILLQLTVCQRFIYNANPPVGQQYIRYIESELTHGRKDVSSHVRRNGAVKWMRAYKRFFQGVSGRPVIKKKIGRQAVWLTSELFRFSGNKLTVGTRKTPVGDMAFNAHRDYRIPNSIRLGVEAGKWFLSFSNEDGDQVPDEAETVAWLRSFSEEDLLARTFGGDRGVETPLAGNHGESFDFDPAQKTRMEKKRRQAKRYQRQMARRRAHAVKEKRRTGANYRKTRSRLAKTHQYGKNVREDFAHKTSRTIVGNSDHLLIVYEDLNVKGMTRKPKARKDENGKWAKNRAAAKAGLNKGILTSTWGKTVTFTKYKAIKAGKLCIKINPYQTSRECAECGHINHDNRVSRSVFVCQACEHQDNADHNAGRVIARRGVRLLLSGGYSPREVKRCGIFRQKVNAPIGPVRSEFTPVESIVSRVAGNGQTRGTEHPHSKGKKQETLSARKETQATTA